MSTPLDPLYPGTAIDRMLSVRSRIQSLSPSDLTSDWSSITRPALLKSAGLKDLRSAIPGQGYTGHAFNDWNHVDATCMLPEIQSQTNSDGQVKGISRSNNLHAGIIIASLPEHGPGGTWSTCQLGCSSNPPRDVAHIQFASRIAFKLVWCPPTYTQFVLVDDDGEILNRGRGEGEGAPDLRERERNFKEVEGSKYGKWAFEVDSNGNKTLKEEL
ncbi:hypothetical protein TrLO_g8770 [Triparma laevis f. longispina]|uniref:Uncharacterized protein n=1 Tax=Triparma laevis f. longispina TaxID=1714387 RepID=A0A9W7CE45_9STRA|nr:hypothetical protein TrLO_g8770 [Triparma laevis f. longispina]